MDAIELAWQGLDDPTRLDVASVDYSADGGFVATGRQTTETYRAQWDLVVDAEWKTRLLTVDAAGLSPDGSETWQRHLNLWRHDRGGRSQWRCESGESGDVPSHLAPIGVAPDQLELLEGAVDVDLGGCPLTNVMPIQRLGVMRPDVAARDITVAWVSLSDCSVIPALQSYAAAPQALSELATTLDDRVAAVVRYESRQRGVAVELSVDGFGHVVTYPDLSVRIDLD